jgi:hypothetical protein
MNLLMGASIGSGAAGSYYANRNNHAKSFFDTDVQWFDLIRGDNNHKARSGVGRGWNENRVIFVVAKWCEVTIGLKANTPKAGPGELD